MPSPYTVIEIFMTQYRCKRERNARKKFSNVF
uniref:Uncharacterized protein n=1 Tax=Arundo donax TaxID=35708 RepID=A0A0A9ESG6_ARUDO